MRGEALFALAAQSECQGRWCRAFVLFAAREAFVVFEHVQVHVIAHIAL